jgi:hypothetical protein
MPTTSDIDDVLADPDFHGLPLGDRLDILKRNYPEFSALNPSDQGRLIAKTQQDAVGTTAAVQQGQPTSGDSFITAWGKRVAAIPSALMATGTGDTGDMRPLGIIPSMANAQHEEFDKARNAYSQGRYVEAAGYGAAGALPIVGPAAAQIGEEIGSGHYGEAGADALMLGAPEAYGRLMPSSVSIPKPALRTVENVNNPVEEAALQSVQGKVRMTPGQRAGQVGLQSAERNLRNMPGTSTEAEQFYRGAQDDLAKEGAARIQQQGQTPGFTPQTTNAYGAGQAVQQALTDRVAALKKYADKLYDSTRQTTARNTQSVQTGTTQGWQSNPAAAMDPSAPVTIPVNVPVMATMESPVDLGPIRKQLQPIYDDLSSNLTPVKQQNSPAFTALKNLMDRTDITHMNAMDFDKFLGAMKSITRDGTSPILSTQSQRLARQVISSGEQQFQNAVQSAGPNVLAKLQNARRAVAEYHNTADFLGDLKTEPGALYSNLTTGGDRVQNTLQALHNQAPKALDTVGRTFLGELMDKATRDGGWARSSGVKADWDRLGPESKNLLFGPNVTQNLNDFFLAAKRLDVPEGSPTAGRLAAILSYGDIGTAIAEFATGAALGHPIAGAAGAAGTLFKTRIQPAVLAKLSFRPAGALLLKQAMTVPINSPEFGHVMTALNSMAIEDNPPVPDRSSVAPVGPGRGGIPRPATVPPIAPTNPYAANPYK